MDTPTRKWEKYQDLLNKGDWHVHTDYVEGENSILELCEQAEKNGLEIICFAEHVRKNLNYDFSSFTKDIENTRKRFPKMKILVGCETKILLNGEIDVSDEVLKMCDIVIASFHGFPPEKSEQIRALKRVVENPHVDIWGHPATLFRNFDLTKSEMENIINACIENKVLIERNLCPKYISSQEFTKLIEKSGAKTVTGSDAHSVWDLRKMN